MGRMPASDSPFLATPSPCLVVVDDFMLLLSLGGVDTTGSTLPHFGETNETDGTDGTNYFWGTGSRCPDLLT
jgi:hypothetical protein